MVSLIPSSIPPKQITSGLLAYLHNHVYFSARLKLALIRYSLYFLGRILMKKNQLVILTVFVMAIGFVILLANRIGPLPLENNSNTLAGSVNSTGTLTAAVPFYDLGTISMSAGKVSQIFKITNSGKAPVRVKKIYTSCMCTTATLTTKEGKAGPFGMPGHAMIPTISQVIIPNEEASVEAVFDPAAHGPQGVGRVRRTIYIETDAQKDPLELTFEANVIS